MVELAPREADAVKVFRALGDPTRFGIVRLLLENEELGCADFQGTFPLSSPALSHHFRILQDCGLLVMRKEGSFHRYRLRRDRLERLLPGFVQTLRGAEEASN